jgi:geranylgeranyl diphosphate synthase, type II
LTLSTALPHSSTMAATSTAAATSSANSTAAVTSSLDSTHAIAGLDSSNQDSSSNRRKTSHLKEVPETLELRESMRARCADVASRIPRESPLTKDEMEKVARELLGEADLPESFLGWTMVMLSSEFWAPALKAVPPHRRLFLLPHCLKHAEGCPAEYDQFGLNCKQCGACSIADYRGLAEQMGYRVLVAEGSPVVMKIIVGGYVDAVIGVACLNVLEKAIDKVLLAGIPCMAVPLLSSDCRNTKVDPEWVNAMIRTPYEPATQQTRSYVHLMRAAANLFEQKELVKVSPPLRGEFDLTESALTLGQCESIDPIATTERISYDFLARGGKHSRPFITLAAYDAMKGGDCTGPEGQRMSGDLPMSVRRAAMSIETFHKASLVHDDIQDDDAFRYGQSTIHQRFGMSTAINVGDYLIGLGYRLLSRSGGDENQSEPVETAIARVDVLDNLAAAHMRLAEGQGAELLWRDGRNRVLSPLDALKIYALKTSPAFEAALYSGIRLAGEAQAYQEPIRTFSRNLGVAFQILNDIGDFLGDEANKGSAAGDLLGGRPTLLWALALESLDTDDRQLLLSLASPDTPMSSADRLRIGRQLYEKASVIDTAMRLVDKHQSRAEAVADALDNDPLRRLLYFLVDTVLERPEIPGQESKSPAVVQLTVAREG